MTEVKIIGGEMHAVIQSPAEGREQTVRIPLTIEGLRILHRIISAESHFRHGRRLGTEAEPTQALVNAWLRAERQREIAKQASGVEDLELEIDL